MTTEVKQNMKDIKDYLHLYLGCEFVSKWPGWQAENDPFILCPADLERGKFEYIKPILRPLSSMTEEETEQYLRLKHNAYSGEYEIKISDAGFWWLFKGISTDQKFKFFGEILDESNAEQFQYLLSKSFDLFGLIEDGLAIDKTKL